MKTDYIEIKIVDESGFNQVGISIGDNPMIIYLPKDCIKQAQVLAVEELLKSKQEILFNEGKIFYQNTSLTLSQLTSLVRGKERTLDDVNREIKELWDAEGVSAEWCIRIQELAKEAEQLLKKQGE